MRLTATQILKRHFIAHKPQLGLTAIQILMAIIIGVVIVSSVFVGATYKRTEKVIQGTLISYDADNKLMIIDDELTPEGDKIPFYIGKAEEEGLPPVGGIIRVSYRVEDKKNVALRLVDLERAVELLGLKK
jgi:hypothetical protein